jgi:hypothetical protein
MEAIHSSEVLVHTRSTWHHIPEYGILEYFGMFVRPVDFVQTGKQT